MFLEFLILFKFKLVIIIETNVAIKLVFEPWNVSDSVVFMPTCFFLPEIISKQTMVENSNFQTCICFEWFNYNKICMGTN